MTNTQTSQKSVSIIKRWVPAACLIIIGSVPSRQESASTTQIGIASDVSVEWKVRPAFTNEHHNGCCHLHKESFMIIQSCRLLTSEMPGKGTWNQ